MKKMAREQYSKVVTFMKTHAEKIDRVMYEYIFLNKPFEEVVDILQSYQSEDGGFGMLDYDIAYPYSCLKTGESACRYIYALRDIPASHPMIQKMIPYIIANYNRKQGNGTIIPFPNSTIIPMHRGGITKNRNSLFRKIEQK